MNRTLRTTAVATLALLSAAACTDATRRSSDTLHSFETSQPSFPGFGIAAPSSMPSSAACIVGSSPRYLIDLRG